VGQPPGEQNDDYDDDGDDDDHDNHIDDNSNTANKNNPNENDTTTRKCATIATTTTTTTTTTNNTSSNQQWEYGSNSNKQKQQTGSDLAGLYAFSFAVRASNVCYACAICLCKRAACAMPVSACVHVCVFAYYVHVRACDCGLGVLGALSELFFECLD
jgi:hypothetical protein